MPTDEDADSRVHVTQRPTGPELGRVADAFHAARGLEADADWAELALVRMVLEDVRIDVAEQVLTEAAGTVREAQESPAELFGDPPTWADQQAEQLREAGLDVFEDPLIMGWREGVLTTLGLASGFSALLFLSQLLDLVFGGENGPTDVTPGFALMPLLLSAMIVVVIAVYKRTVARFRFPIVVALCAAAVVLGAGGTASIIMPLAREGSDARLTWGWGILLVPLYAALCWVVAKLWAAPTEGPGDGEGGEDGEALTAQQILDSAHLDDEDWVRRARSALRRRDDLTDPRIDAVLAEARDHAADSGAPLVEEFGSPEGYAQKLPKHTRTIPRRMTLFYVVLALLWLALALTNAAGAGWRVGWSVAAPAVLVIVFAAQAVGRARAWRRAGRSG